MTLLRSTPGELVVEVARLGIGVGVRDLLGELAVLEVRGERDDLDVDVLRRLVERANIAPLTLLGADQRGAGRQFDGVAVERLGLSRLSTRSRRRRRTGRRGRRRLRAGGRRGRDTRRGRRAGRHRYGRVTRRRRSGVRAGDWRRSGLGVTTTTVRREPDDGRDERENEQDRNRSDPLLAGGHGGAHDNSFHDRYSHGCGFVCIIS